MTPIISCNRSLPAESHHRLISSSAVEAFSGSVRTSNATHNQDLLAADVGHRALGDLHQHGEDSLLQREAKVLRRDDVVAVIVGRSVRLESFVCGVCFRGREDAGQTYVHAFGSIWEWQQTLSPVSRQCAHPPRGEDRIHFFASCSML